MEVLKCTVCGGELSVNADMSVGVCEYCGSTIIIPKQLDKKGNLYNRAVFLRQNNEFDKALLVYEDILKEDNTDAEAHWGLVLSKYGIEYVVDPYTGKHMPTCHRTQEDSILSDPDYLAALQYSDAESRAIIEEEAARISKIQQHILDISRQEPPYDIFICYKESDEAGNRTEDSVHAQDLYYELLKKDYKVFFARKTLESKLGSEYEPIIYAALNSAKVMIVLGTKAEYFDAVWVKNEWSRFLKMAKDSKKTIIPAYRGMTAYDLPVELSRFQALDMSRIGFMQDLIDGIDKCMRDRQIKQESVVTFTDNRGSEASLERMLKNGETFIELNNFKEAQDVYKNVTKNYPEEYKGWWGLIVASTHNLNPSKLVSPEQMLIQWYNYVKKLASADVFHELEQKYLDYIAKSSVMYVGSETKAVNDIMSNCDAQIQEENRMVQTLNAETSERKRRYEQIDKECSDRISRLEMDASNKRNQIQSAQNKKSVAWMVLGISMGIGALMTLFGSDMFGPAIFWIGLITGVCMLKGALSNADIDAISNQISTLNSQISECENRRKKDKSEYERVTQANSRKRETHRKKISEIQVKKDKCKEYLQYGEGVIAEIICASRCQQVGVSRVINQQAVELRKQIFENVG